MTTRLGLSAMKRHTSYAPLAALGYVLHQSAFFAPLREHVQLGGKTILHEPYQKLLDVVVSLLADCASLKQINTRLRPDTALAAAWGRHRFADQSTITRVLDTLYTIASACPVSTALTPSGAGSSMSSAGFTFTIRSKLLDVTQLPLACEPTTRR